MNKNPIFALICIAGFLAPEWALAQAAVPQIARIAVDQKVDTKFLLNGMEISVKHDVEGVEIVSEQATFRLPRNRSIVECVSNENLGIAILRVSFGDKINPLRWYWGLILVTVEAGQITFSDVMDQITLQESDKRRRYVKKISDFIEDFPRIQLLMVTYDLPTLPSGVQENWESWNIISGEFIRESK
ncbi:MAG: hypothetical protein JNK37_13735 [Verrucomicrobiales bacterium]|nr:hypothetical protein [Verrucomicrobiales bacterium]